MNKFLALDFETSGTNPEEDAPVSIGVALMEGTVVIDQYTAIFAEFPKRRYDIRAMRISRTTWAQVQKGQPVTDIFKELETFVSLHCAQELPVVSHNAKFDQGFWDVLALECGCWKGKWPDRKYVKEKELLRGPWYCTMRMTDPLRSDEGVIPDSKLDSVAAHFGFARETETHGALEDAILAGRIFAALTSQAVAA